MESGYEKCYHAANRDTLLQTNGAWCAAGLADPNLWTDLFVDHTTYSNMDRLRTYVRRAGWLPIKLRRERNRIRAVTTAEIGPRQVEQWSQQSTYFLTAQVLGLRRFLLAIILVNNIFKKYLSSDAPF